MGRIEYRQQPATSAPCISHAQKNFFAFMGEYGYNSATEYR